MNDWFAEQAVLSGLPHCHQALPGESGALPLPTRDSGDVRNSRFSHHKLGNRTVAEPPTGYRSLLSDFDTLNSV